MNFEECSPLKPISSNNKPSLFLFVYKNTEMLITLMIYRGNVRDFSSKDFEQIVVAISIFGEKRKKISAPWSNVAWLGKGQKNMLCITTKVGPLHSVLFGSPKLFFVLFHLVFCFCKNSWNLKLNHSSRFAWRIIYTSAKLFVFDLVFYCLSKSFSMHSRLISNSKTKVVSFFFEHK